MQEMRGLYPNANQDSVLAALLENVSSKSFGWKSLGICGEVGPVCFLPDLADIFISS